MGQTLSPRSRRRGQTPPHNTPSIHTRPGAPCSVPLTLSPWPWGPMNSHFSLPSTMYWSDWGNHPKIETAAMDGTLRETLVQDNIQWPTGPWGGVRVWKGQALITAASEVTKSHPCWQWGGQFPADQAEGRGRVSRMGNWERAYGQGRAAVPTGQSWLCSLPPAWRDRR